MSVSLPSLQFLGTLGLTTEQMAGVFKVLAVELAPLDAIRKAQAERQRRSRDGHALDSRDVDVTNGLARVNDTTLPSLLVETVRKEEPPINPPSLLSKPLPLEHPRFPEFWAVYPRRSGTAARKPACGAFSAACRRTDPQLIIDGAKRFAIHQTAEGTVGTRFIPQARKWLNNELWTETYEAAPAHHKPGSNSAAISNVRSVLARQLAEAERGSGSDREDIETIPGLRQSVG